MTHRITVRGTGFFIGLLGVVLSALLLPGFASAAECTDTWTGGAEGSWTSAGSWSEGHVPGPTDVACVGSGKRVTVSEGLNQVAVVQGGGTLVLAFSTLEITSGTSNIGEFVEGAGGILTGPGILETPSLEWAEGEMTGSGATVVTGTGTLGNGGSEMTLSGRTFVNEGTTTIVPSTRLWEEKGAEVSNQGTFVLNSQYEPGIADAGGSPSFVNDGTLVKTTGTGAGHVQVDIQNFGTIEAASGSLEFGGGGTAHSGTWDAVEPGAIELNGGTFLLKGGTLSHTVVVRGSAVFEGATVGSLHLDVYGGSVTVSKNLSVASFEGAGTLKGPATFETPSLLWQGGTMSGSGSTVVAKGGTGTITAAGSEPVLSERTFLNKGTVTVPPTTRIWERNGAVIRNEGTFVLNSQYEPTIGNQGGSPRFVNIDLLTKNVGAGVSQIEVPTYNFGPIKPETGTIEILHPISGKGSEATPNQACSVAADPVQCATGDFTETQNDFAIGGRGVGLDLTRTYSAQAAAEGNTGIFGRGWSYSFGDHLTSEEGGARVTFTDSSGATTTFSKSGIFYHGPSWSQDELERNEEGGFSLVLPDQTIEAFSSSGRLESVTDRNGNQTIFGYEGSGRLETITDPTGRTITLTYNGSGLVESAEDPMGHVVHYTYESGNLKTVELPGESSPNWTFGYDGSHRMTSMIDGRGGETTNEFDSANRVIAQTDPAGHKTTFSYGSFETTITNKSTGSVSYETFNSDNQPISITRGYGTALATTESFTYTPQGFLASKTDGNGHTTTFGYDVFGNRTNIQDAEGDETIWTYNGDHQILSEARPNGEETAIVRDANGNPETISRPAPGAETQTFEYAYGPHGEVESFTDSLGQTWTDGYDPNGDLESETDPEGAERTWTYDEDSRVVSTAGPRGNEVGAETAEFTTRIERDPQNRPLKVVDPSGGATEYAYDPDGNLESVTDPNGHTTTFGYNADNEQTKIERANGEVEEAGYDGSGQITSQTDGEKHKTIYVRNVLEQPVEKIDPLERKTSSTFDAAGNQKTLKDADGRTTTYSYDKADRLTGVDYSSEPGQDASFSYDEDGNVTAMVDSTGESTYKYDQLDRLIASEDGNGKTVDWEYNLGDEPVGLTYPNGKSISRHFDDAGRLGSVTDWLGHTISFGYDADSDLTSTTFPAGTGDVDHYTFDHADRMNGVTFKKGATTLASLGYSRDPAGQIEQIANNGLPGAEEEGLSYDENERLTGSGGGGFEYDAANNLTEAPGSTNAFDKAGQLESATGATFTYDEEGERTIRTPSSGPATDYEYDQAGNLVSVGRPGEGETPAIAESLAYDGSGLLSSRTVGLATHDLVWDLGEAPEALLSDGEQSYIYGPGGLAVEQISSEEVPSYLHHDQLGSTRALTNSSGEVAATFTYGPYGTPAGHTGSTTTVLGYAGQYTLGQSGLLDLRARYYDPATAQFLTLDPLDSVTRAPYLYALDDPINHRDRTGRDAESIEGGGCPPGICYPFLTEEQAQRLAGNIEEIPGEIADEISGFWNWVTGNEDSSEGEADKAKDEAQPCPENFTTEIGDAGQSLRKAEQEVAKLGHPKNPDSPSFSPGGTKGQRIGALLGKLFPRL